MIARFLQEANTLMKNDSFRSFLKNKKIRSFSGKMFGKYISLHDDGLTLTDGRKGQWFTFHSEETELLKKWRNPCRDFFIISCALLCKETVTSYVNTILLFRILEDGRLTLAMPAVYVGGYMRNLDSKRSRTFSAETEAIMRKLSTVNDFDVIFKTLNNVKFDYSTSFTESVNEGAILEKNRRKLWTAIDKLDNVMATMRKGQDFLSDGRPFPWFQKKNGTENILCFPYIHYYEDKVSDYVGIYASYDDTQEQESCEKSFGYLVSYDDKENTRKVSDFARKVIYRLSTLPDWKSMQKELDKVSKKMDGFDWVKDSFL